MKKKQIGKISWFYKIWLLLVPFIIVIRIIRISDKSVVSKDKEQKTSNQYYRPKIANEIDAKKIIGKWETEDMLEIIPHFKHEVIFYDEGIGKSTSFMYTENADTCVCTTYFFWEQRVENSTNYIVFRPKKIDISSCENIALNEIEADFFEALKRNYNSKFFEKRIEFSHKNNKMLMDGNYYNPISGIKWENILRQENPEFGKYLGYKNQTDEYLEYIKDNFVKNSKTQGMPSFDIIIDDFSLVIKNFNNHIKVASGVIIEKKYYIKPDKWVSNNTSFYKFGEFKSIRYIDHDGELKKGNLLIFDQSQEGFMFAKDEKGFFW